MKEFLEFKRVTGHTRVPTGHPTLGPWIMNTRRAYKKKMANDPSIRLSDDQIKQLKDAGFIFEAAKTKSSANRNSVDGRTVPKPWIERFEQLKDFKAQHGHTIVPQSYPQLGWWVHDQRKVRKRIFMCLFSDKDNLTNNSIYFHLIYLGIQKTFKRQEKQTKYRQSFEISRNWFRF